MIPPRSPAFAGSLHLGLLVCALCVTACQRTAPSNEELLREGQDEARRFFALAEGGDCAQLGPLLARPDSCEGIVKDFRETHTHMTAVEGAKIDGRDPHVVLVTVNAQSTKHEHTWVMRMKWTDAGWRVSP